MCVSGPYYTQLIIRTRYYAIYNYYSSRDSHAINETTDSLNSLAIVQKHCYARSFLYTERKLNDARVVRVYIHTPTLARVFFYYYYYYWLYERSGRAGITVI